MDLHKEVTRIEKKRRDGERMAGQKKKEGKKEGKERGWAGGEEENKGCEVGGREEEWP